MDNPGEILRLCRLCLVKDQVNIPIFEEQGDIRQIFLKISSCLPVTVSRDDQLPKKICDGCSNKLDLLYEFWNTSANAEKTLLSWLGQAGVKDADETISAVAQQIAKPAETQVKQEDLEDGHAISQDNFGLQSFDEDTKDEAEPPPRKRARRTAAVKAQISIAPESDDDDDDMDNTEAMTKVEGESEESDGEDRDPSYGEVPGTSADDQAGPSGVGKDGVEAPLLYNDHLYATFHMDTLQHNLHLIESFDCQKTENIPASSVVDQLNVSDELLNLLSTEEECTAILNNIASNEHFQRLITTESDFVKNTDVQPLIGEKHISTTTNLNVKEDAPKGFKCDICGRVCTTKKLLKKHLIRHNEERRLPCKVCGKLFRFNYEVTAHARTHAKPTFQCDICPQMFIHNSHLTVHRKKHLGEFSSFCELCNKGFVSQAECVNHRKSKHENQGHICETCGKKLRSASSLKEHVSAHCIKNNKIASHICDTCGKNYMTKKSLKSHITSTHTRNKPYICNICGKSVSSKSILETHLKLHTGLKDFFCNICNKAFASKEYLEVHQRIHTGYKPFQCHLCPKNFTQKTSLTVHLRYHTGERPYKCECGKNFATKSHLMAHYRTHDVGGVEIEYLSYQLHDSLQ